MIWNDDNALQPAVPHANHRSGTLESKKAEAINNGSLFHFLETVDANSRRKSSTMFMRVSVFFQAAYPEDGTIFIIVGREQFDGQQYRPDELDRMKELVAGIR